MSLMWGVQHQDMKGDPRTTNPNDQETWVRPKDADVLRADLNTTAILSHERASAPKLTAVS
eukprot:15449846-Alexandrium_andersonii.AAC.1